MVDLGVVTHIHQDLAHQHVSQVTEGGVMFPENRHKDDICLLHCLSLEGDFGCGREEAGFSLRVAAADHHLEPGAHQADGQRPREVPAPQHPDGAAGRRRDAGVTLHAPMAQEGFGHVSSGHPGRKNKGKCKFMVKLSQSPRPQQRSWRKMPLRPLEQKRMWFWSQ